MEDDDRPLIKDLLVDHASMLLEFRQILEKEQGFCKERYDDLWMLRFLLSHKSVSKASKAAIRTMKFRQQKKMNEWGDLRRRIYDHSDPHSDRHLLEGKKIMSCCTSPTAIMFTMPDHDRSLIQIVLTHEIETSKIVEQLSYDETLLAHAKNSECIYQSLDEVTRRTGRLTKTLRIMDVSEFSRKMFNYGYMKREAAITKELEDYFPQMLGMCLYVNPPLWSYALWRLVRPLLPARFLEKVAFVSPSRNPEDAKYFLKYLSEDNLWVRYGGKNAEWPPPAPSHFWENSTNKED